MAMSSSNWQSILRANKQLKQRLSKEEYRQIKGVIWSFCKSASGLNDEDWVLPQKLFIYLPKLEQACTLREELTEIVRDRFTKMKAKCAILFLCKSVCKSRINEFENFLGTVDTWPNKITNYSLEVLSSDFVEGFNNRLKVLKRYCYGIFDVDQIFQRLALDTDEYERFCFTSTYYIQLVPREL